MPSAKGSTNKFKGIENGIIKGNDVKCSVIYSIERHIQYIIQSELNVLTTLNAFQIDKEK